MRDRTGRSCRREWQCCDTLVVVLLVVAFTGMTTVADEKAEVVTGAAGKAEEQEQVLFLYPATAGKDALVTTIVNGERELPVVVVRGTPYEMGVQLGRAIGEQIKTFVPRAMEGLKAELKVSDEDFREVWARTAAFTDDRVEQELIGLADGSGMPLATLQALHTVPLLMPYSCSSVAVWGDATEDGHLYQTRNLDWSLEVKAHEFPVIVVYVPNNGAAHVVPTFAGMIGAHTGMNVWGIALAEMGDSPGREMPYQVHAPHFTTYFRTLLYDADSLTEAIEIFKPQPMTKRYHFVFGDGQKDRQAVKIRAHSPTPPGHRVTIWRDNDSTDEFAPNVLPCLVYNDEGRGAFPTLQKQYGTLNGEKMVELANQIPIKGGNVSNVVYDATALRLWVSYAKGEKEAYQMPYVLLDLKTLDVDGDGKADVGVR